MTTATDISSQDKARKTHLYVSLMESFFKRWAPESGREAAQFHAEFQGLVRQIYEDAAEPWRSHMERILALTNLAHPILKMDPRP